MAIEIERKFLVNGEYKSLSVSHTHIIQGYICSGRGRSVRVRLRDEHSYLTIKGPSFDGGLSRYEFEKKITRDEALSLLRLCDPGIIDKVRWMVPVGGHTFEVDEFFGENEGLVVAEIELRQAEEAFERPSFLGQEVTGECRYYNSQLRVRPYKLWTEAERNGKADGHGVG